MSPSTTPVEVLVVVHPDSACGSADFNLGDDDGAAARELLMRDLAAWTGPVLVLDGMFTDEFARPRYRPFGATLEQLVARAAAGGHLAQRVSAPDPEHLDALPALVRQHAAQWPPDRTLFTCTGAWTVRDDPTDGCVGSAATLLQTLGYATTVRASAVQDPASSILDGPPVPRHAAPPPAARLRR